MNGSPDQITTSAIFPGSSDPVRSSIPRALAGLIVIQRIACSYVISIPASWAARSTLAASWFSRWIPDASSEWTIAHPPASWTRAMFSRMPS